MRQHDAVLRGRHGRRDLAVQEIGPGAQWRRAATYVHRILQRAKPGELAVEQPTTFELTIHMKTAKALGLTVPPALLQRADLVIQ